MTKQKQLVYVVIEYSFSQHDLMDSEVVAVLTDEKEAEELVRSHSRLMYETFELDTIYLRDNKGITL